MRSGGRCSWFLVVSFWFRAALGALIVILNQWIVGAPPLVQVSSVKGCGDSVHVSASARRLGRAMHNRGR